MGETDGSAVVGNNVGDLVGTETLSLDSAELETGLFSIDSDGLEAALDVVEHAEELTGLVDADNILEADGELGVTSDLVVDLDVVGTLILDDLEDFLAAQRVLESVLEEHGHGDALTELVGTGRGARSPGARQLVEHPVLGRCKALKVLLGSASLVGMVRLGFYEHGCALHGRDVVTHHFV